MLTAWTIATAPLLGWTTEVSGNLTDAVLDEDAAEVARILEEGVDPWPTIEVLRERDDIARRRAAGLVLQSVQPTVERLRVRARSVDGPVSWIDRQLVEKLEGPILCAALEFEDAWLASVAIEREEPTAVCRGEHVTVVGARDSDVLKLLLDAGAQIDACALTAAVLADRPLSVAQLLKAGASPRFGCGVVPLFAARSEPVARELLAHGDLDPFDPTLHIEDLLRTWRYPETAIAVTTRFTERRDMVLSWAWATGVGRPRAFAPFLPSEWGQVAHRATPGVSFADFETAWTTAGGATGLLRARGDARLGEPLPALPCPVPQSLTEAKVLLGSVRKTADTSAHRYYQSSVGHYHQRSRGGRWETASWSIDLAQCPELQAKLPMLPVILGANPWITADGHLISLMSDPTLASGRRVWIGVR
ncbi:MAG: hypothetical protein KTR31_33385 [Myxococcales bacterium]|nr:hypothetical protein [Myxococcales bacterium]